MKDCMNCCYHSLDDYCGKHNFYVEADDYCDEWEAGVYPEWELRL